MLRLNLRNLRNLCSSCVCSRTEEERREEQRLRRLKAGGAKSFFASLRALGAFAVGFVPWSLGIGHSLVTGAWALVIHEEEPLTPALSPEYKGEGVNPRST